MVSWLLGLIIFIIIVIIVILALAIKILPEYERAVHFRLGRFIGLKGPGIFLIIPFVDRIKRVDLRVLDLDVPQQRVITQDNVSTNVDAVVYMRVFDPEKSILKVEHYYRATSRLAQTTLRDVLGQVELDALLSKREELSERIRKILDEETDAWGVRVTNVAIQNVNLPEEMVRAIASQAEAERNRRARVKLAKGEKEAAEQMAEAARIYGKSDAAMRLRELQTLVEIATEQNLVVVAPSKIGTELGGIAGLTSALQKQSERRKSKEEEEQS
ncbi:membrane protease subunit, stomatin/prohibitin-like protein [candidate division MSBL1 archaeon SCGC-AAA261O19]|uniref:Membrane protease subunit, stomatin/prohibitin-like protein n=3 Tax=candidate division MSBL1 TaxID=215777 RepID=A0A133V0D7_9EURY|nr:membrane protease subunit, stomatin/prohibitin-like protein [candidate division MSBL1 archaeon SCGC-AAA261C02]KXB04628.1 membrane protease subunit, stomatin/prohibitin-like protein [candidate division MSBL1 archaeon SCGC-AAA261O19]KXB09215.1 membrane protease subunit, stomatin/prohibitin-like protein [candidate division MSBL1 archaeon SCGC-AAA833K04]